MRSPPLGPRAGGGQKRGIDCLDGRSNEYSYTGESSRRRSLERYEPDSYRDPGRRVSRPTFNEVSISSRHSSPDRSRSAPIDRAVELDSLEKFLRIMISTFTAMDKETKTATMVERLAAFTTDSNQSAIVEARRQLQAARDDVRDKMVTLYEAWVPLITRRPVPLNQSRPSSSSGAISLDGLMARVAQLEKGMTDRLALGNGRGDLHPPTPISAPPRGDPRLARIQNGDTDESGPSNKRQKSTSQSDELAEALVKVKAMETLLLGFEERFNEMENWKYQTEGARAGGEAAIESWDDLENLRDPTRRLRGQAAVIEAVVEDSWDDLENARDPHRQLRGPEKPVEEEVSWDDLENSRDPNRELRGPAAAAVAPAAQMSSATDELLAAQAQKLEEQAGLVSVLRQKVKNMGDTIKELKEDKAALEQTRESDATKLEDTLQGMINLIKQTCEKEANERQEILIAVIKDTCEREAKEAMEGKIALIKQTCEKEVKDAMKGKDELIEKQVKDAVEGKDELIKTTCFKESEIAIQKALHAMRAVKEEQAIAARARNNSNAVASSSTTTTPVASSSSNSGRRVAPRMSRPSAPTSAPSQTSTSARPYQSVSTSGALTSGLLDHRPLPAKPTSAKKRPLSPAQAETPMSKPAAAVSQMHSNGPSAKEQPSQKPPSTSSPPSAAISAPPAPKLSSSSASADTAPAMAATASSAGATTSGTEQRRPSPQSSVAAPPKKLIPQPPSTSSQSTAAHSQLPKASPVHTAPTHPSLPARPAPPAGESNGTEQRARQNSGPTNPSSTPQIRARVPASSSSRPATPTFPPLPPNPPSIPPPPPTPAKSEAASEMDMDIDPPDDRPPTPQSASFMRAKPPHQQDGALSANQRQDAIAPTATSASQGQNGGTTPDPAIIRAPAQTTASGSRPTSSSGATPAPGGQRPSWATAAPSPIANPASSADLQRSLSSGMAAAVPAKLPGGSDQSTSSAPRAPFEPRKAPPAYKAAFTIPGQTPTPPASTGMVKSASDQAFSIPHPGHSTLPKPPFNTRPPSSSTPIQTNAPPAPFRLAVPSSTLPPPSRQHVLAVSSHLRQGLQKGQTLEAVKYSLPTAARTTLAGLSASQIEDIVKKPASDWTWFSEMGSPTPSPASALPPPPPPPPQLAPGPYSAPDTSISSSGLAARITTGSKGPLSNRIGASGAATMMIGDTSIGAFPIYAPPAPIPTSESNGFRGLNAALGFDPEASYAAHQRMAAAEAELRRPAPPSRSPSFQNMSSNGHSPNPQRDTDSDVQMEDTSRALPDPKPVAATPRPSSSFGSGSSLGARLGNALRWGKGGNE